MAQERKLLIFDFDGTVVDTFPNYVACMVAYAKEKNVLSDSEKFTVGYVDPDKFDMGWGIPLNEQKEFYETFNAYYNDQNAHHQRFLPTLFPGALETLKELGKHYDMAVVTTRHRHSLDSILKHNGMDQMFIGLRTHQDAEEGGYPLKPAPDAIHDLLAVTKHDIQNCLVIGDTTADVGMANAARIKSIAVLWGAHSRERLQAENPNRMVENMSDLPRVVKEVFALS